MNNKTLAVFFSRNISLKSWYESGLFFREKLIYERHLELKTFQKIYWFTYGNNDKQLSDKLKNEKKLHENIIICQMPNIFSKASVLSSLYSFLIFIFYYKTLKSINIFKSNQMDGAWAPLICKFVFRKPFILRTGYTLSIFLKKRSKSKIKIFLSMLLEKTAYKFADLSLVSSIKDKEYIINKYNTVPSKIDILYNYIDIELFKDMKMQRKSKILFVGRLSNQKNLENIINAIKSTNFRLDIYGEGEEKENLNKLASKNNVNIKFKGLIENSKLPLIFNDYKYYILASHYEGMPKTLLEAMASGCLCIGTNVDGINEVIEHNKNGILINNTDSNSILNILNILENIEPSFYKTLTSNGVKTIEETFSLASIAKKEKKLINNLMESK